VDGQHYYNAPRPGLIPVEVCEFLPGHKVKVRVTRRAGSYLRNDFLVIFRHQVVEKTTDESGNNKVRIADLTGEYCYERR